jgi:hypothetical protein
MKCSEEKKYAITGGLNLFVYSFPKDPYDKSKTQQDRLQPVNNYFRRGSGWTTIWYKVDIPGNVSLKLYTITGELVKTLFNGYKEAGEYSELWTGRNDFGDEVGTGIYLLQLTAPGTNVIKKICITR